MTESAQWAESVKSSFSTTQSQSEETQFLTWAEAVKGSGRDSSAFHVPQFPESPYTAGVVYTVTLTLAIGKGEGAGNCWSTEALWISTASWFG